MQMRTSNGRSRSFEWRPNVSTRLRGRRAIAAAAFFQLTRRLHFQVMVAVVPSSTVATGAAGAAAAPAAAVAAAAAGGGGGGAASGIDRLPIVGDVLRSDTNYAYSLKHVLGEGGNCVTYFCLKNLHILGYGTVFEAHDVSSRRYALKAERWSKTVLKIEIAVLRATAERSCRQFCQLVDVGRVANEYMFIVLTLLGADLARLRNDMPDRHFKLATAVRVAMQTSTAIEELHKTGFISRDVKPGNFAIGNRAEDLHRCIYMIDFGLSRRYTDRNGSVIPARVSPGWRGTSRYASLQAHAKADLSRRDDFESWLYMIVEITKGQLPWRLVNDRAKVQDLKTTMRTIGRVDFFKGCPKQYDQLLVTIDKLTFESTPPYESILKMLIECCTENNIKMAQKYDWESENTSSVHTSVTYSCIEKSPSSQQRANNVERPTNMDVR